MLRAKCCTSKKTFTKWLLSRKIYVADFAVQAKVNCEQYLQYAGQKLRFIEAIRHPNYTFVPDTGSIVKLFNTVATHCAALEAVTITIGCFVALDLTKEHVSVLARLPNLKRLNIDESTLERPDSLCKALPSWQGLLVFQAACCNLKNLTYSSWRRAAQVYRGWTLQGIML